MVTAFPWIRIISAMKAIPDFYGSKGANPNDEFRIQEHNRMDAETLR